MNIAIILAAGRSRRLGKISKIFYEIGGKPLIFYSLRTFVKHPKIQKIILVARKRDFKKFQVLIKKWKFQKIIALIEGGKERQDSAFRGLEASEKLGAKSDDLILFHNGANPLVSQKEISKVLKAAKKYGAALAGQLAKDTIKKINKRSLVVQTMDRKNVFLAQTPQVIEYTLAKKAFEKAKKEKFRGTDDVSLVERLGRKVKAIPCPSQNIKVTTKEDLKILKIFLAKHDHTVGGRSLSTLPSLQTGRFAPCNCSAIKHNPRF